MFSTFCFLSTLLFVGCTERMTKAQQLIDEKISLQNMDQRTNIAAIEVINENGKLKVVGETTLPSLLSELETSLNELHIPYEISKLPDEAADAQSYGIVNLSVINIRKEPNFSSELVSQALLGTPVRVLKKDDWYLIRTPDQYIGWCNSSAIEPMSKKAYQDWINVDKVVVTAPYAQALQKPDNGTPLCDLVAGNMINRVGSTGDYYEILLPDGRKGHLHKTAGQPFGSWQAERNFTPDEMVEQAITHTGIPYLWGGTSYKGVDCSGLIRNAAMMCGVMLPRDASQMALVGKRIDPNSELSNLHRGDLLFFGPTDSITHQSRVTHVGLYMGNKNFIHASGKVKINSLDPHSSIYDAYNHKRLLWATELYDSINTKDITPVKNFYLQANI